jgi:hypothetical protein
VHTHPLPKTPYVFDLILSNSSLPSRAETRKFLKKISSSSQVGFGFYLSSSCLLPSKAIPNRYVIKYRSSRLLLTATLPQSHPMVVLRRTFRPFRTRRVCTLSGNELDCLLQRLARRRHGGLKKGACQDESTRVKEPALCLIWLTAVGSSTPLCCLPEHRLFDVN